MKKYFDIIVIINLMIVFISATSESTITAQSNAIGDFPSLFSTKTLETSFYKAYGAVKYCSEFILKGCTNTYESYIKPVFSSIKKKWDGFANGSKKPQEPIVSKGIEDKAENVENKTKSEDSESAFTLPPDEKSNKSNNSKDPKTPEKKPDEKSPEKEKKPGDNNLRVFYWIVAGILTGIAIILFISILKNRK